MLEFLRSGGPVLWLILALGAIALVVFLERSLQLHRDRIDSTDFLQGIFNALGRGNDREARSLASRILPRRDEFRGEDASDFRALAKRLGLTD